MTPEVKEIYDNALATYAEAQANLDKLGAVVAHPKTGAPIENPYLKIRDKAAALIIKCQQADKKNKPKFKFER